MQVHVLDASGHHTEAGAQVRVFASGGRLIGTAPQSIKGMLEVRGVGILPMPVKARSVIAMVADLIPGLEGRLAGLAMNVPVRNQVLTMNVEATSTTR